MNPVTRIIDIKEVGTWLEQRGLRGPKLYDLVEEVDHSGLIDVRWFSIPNSRAIIPLAETFAAFFADEEEVLLYIDDWHNSLADYNLFERFRQGLGETSKVWEKPGHLFYPGDEADLLSLLRIALYFMWGVYVISSSGRVVVEVFDGDIAAVYGADPGKLDKELLVRLDDLAVAGQEPPTDPTKT
jgi:hypothetical protein